MKTLQINEKTARRLYKSATEEFKAILEDTFGADFFLEKITDRVKTYEDACGELGVEPLDEEGMLAVGFRRSEIAGRKLEVVVMALNEGWEPDWSNEEQRKWVPAFYIGEDDFLFDYVGFVTGRATASYASRFCLRSKWLAEYAGKQFVDLYKGFIEQ